MNGDVADLGFEQPVQPARGGDLIDRGETRAAALEPLSLIVALPRDQLEALAQRVADLLGEQQDDGFLDVAAAAKYLSTTRKAIYHLVERQRLPHHRAGGRLLFDRKLLRVWVERG